MDIEIGTETFINFLNKAKLDKLVQDLKIETKDKMLFAKFIDLNSSSYSEIYENSLKIHETGEILIASLDKLLNSLSRIDGKVIRIKTNQNHFVITDGSKITIRLTQSLNDQTVESYSRIKNRNFANFFVKEKLSYLDGKIQYKSGFEIDFNELLDLLKDAKAFGFEVYKFEEDERKNLFCTIKSLNKDIQDKFVRKFENIKKIGEERIVPICVGTGFREMVLAIGREKNENKRVIKIYFHEKSLLITDENKFYYNLHFIKE